MAKMEKKDDFVKMAMFAGLGLGAAYVLWKSRLARRIAVPLAGIFLPQIIDKGLEAIPDGKAKDFLREVSGVEEKEGLNVH